MIAFNQDIFSLLMINMLIIKLTNLFFKNILQANRKR